MEHSIDREKVIKGLECHADRTNMSCNIAKCPYYELDFCGVRLAQDALAMLKEQDVAYHGAEELLRQKTILFDDAIKRLKEQEEEIYKLQKELNYWQGKGR